MNLNSIKLQCKILKIALSFSFFLGIILTPSFHYIIYKYLFFIYKGNIYHYRISIFKLYSIGICALFIVKELILICKLIETNMAFSYKIVKSLKHIYFACFTEALVFIIAFILFPEFFSPIVILAFTLIGMLICVLSNLFKSAIEFKEENDLTI